MAFGSIQFIEDLEEKRQGLNHLMVQYAEPKQTFSFPALMLKRIAVLKMPIGSITGKTSSKD